MAIKIRKMTRPGSHLPADLGMLERVLATLIARSLAEHHKGSAEMKRIGPSAAAAAVTGAPPANADGPISIGVLEYGEPARTDSVTP